MASIHRINAVIAYNDGSTSNYTSADDGETVRLSLTDVDQVESELFSWPSFRDFMESIDSLTLTDPIDISHISDITWSVTIQDETGRSVIGGFEATGGSGSTSNATYDPDVFPSFDTDIEDKLETETGPTGTTATATAIMLPVGTPVVVARGSGYRIGEITLTGGTFTEAAVVTITKLSTVSGQDETDFGGGELNGTFTGGTGYSATDTITMNDGTVVIVDTVAVGVVTEFTVTTPTTPTSAGGGNDRTLTQSSTSGGGSGFTLTLDDNNQGVAEGTYKQAMSVNLGVYSVLPP